MSAQAIYAAMACSIIGACLWLLFFLFSPFVAGGAFVSLIVTVAFVLLVKGDSTWGA